MLVFKCKMCGGDLVVDQPKTVGTCAYCGSTMAIPRNPDQIRTNLYNRANHFRLNNEFDKAAGIFESILNQYPQEAEAHWGLVLCKYGVNYVEDPTTRRMIPTCHRTQYVSIMADPDYKAAISFTDPQAQVVYESEARAIDEIQKQILEISSKEEPFDVFICYKEVDENGNRTKDSVLAQEIYHQLTQAGFKVFFSRITLEDKLGSAYEPYIFAALNSAKVMVVVGTKPEYLNAVWVKNEWSRYLSLIKQGEQKTLIPAYRDMDVYDLPDEFSYLQAQDMSKLGFMQDLIRGIQKLVAVTKRRTPSTASVISGSTNMTSQSLVDRAFLCLEDEEFKKADDLLEQALNIDPRNASAYVGKLMVREKLKTEEELEKVEQPLTDYKEYCRATQFANDEYRFKLEKYNLLVLDRLEQERKEKIYQIAIIVKENLERLEQERKEKTYQAAISMKEKQDANFKIFREAAKQFRSISGYKDADELAKECDALEEKEKKKNKITLRILIIFVVILALVCIFLCVVGAFVEGGNLAKSLLI